ncbi:hypothetical protein FE840_009885 [Peteryoungia desertarenae]|uniref:Uncharacterized protein n=1 Tax=Peteryoungia desertarenae TaxID=1813451 RepID=A0ABX6QNM3_9HYPH|nr:hypothetical protein [Peteryoungia desertarenae]QLF69825.1 hypothetical protein FE840_009885 [Peteryoungia desertarenae]
MADIIRIIDRIARSAGRSARQEAEQPDQGRAKRRLRKAKVLFFTGVRYERLEPAGPASQRPSLPAPTRFLQIPALTDLRQP